MIDALSQFTQSQTQDQQSKAEKAMNDASSEGKSKTIDVAGTYRMRVKTVVSPKGVWPRFEISTRPKTDGDLVLNILLECVDGTPAVNRGDTFFVNVYVKKAPGATDEKIRNTASFCKPILCALTGRKDIPFTDDFLREYFSVDIDDQGKITRMHKMNSDVMVVIEKGRNPTTGKEVLGHKNIRAALEGEVSKSVKNSDPVTAGAVLEKGKEIQASQGEMKKVEMDMSLPTSFDGDAIPSGDTVEDS